MEETFLLQLAVIFLALLFCFTNGFHDSSNQVAAAISARTLSPESALILAALSTFVGAYFLGTRVAWTLGRELFSLELNGSREIVLYALISALLSVILWNFLTWRLGIPSSSSHALLGGLMGAFLAALGVSSLDWEKLKWVFLMMLFSPIIGFSLTYPFTKLTFFMGQNTTPKFNRFIRGMQSISLIGQSLCYGSNDAQKVMGVIGLALIVSSPKSLSNSSENWIPVWVIFISSVTLSIGVLMGGWRLIRTLGRGLYPIRAIHAFASQTTSASILYIASIFGYPLSSTQVVSASILGAGAAFRPKSVRWTVAEDLATAWLLTIPICAGMAALTFKLIQLFL